MKRGFFAVGVYQPKTEVNIGTLWRTAGILGAAFIFTVGRRYRPQASDTLKVPRHTPLFNFAGFEDLLAHMPDSTPLVGVELAPGAIDIADFSHPERACYLLGAEDNGIPGAILSRCHHTVRLLGDHSMNVAVAGSIVMYHRALNRGNA